MGKKRATKTKSAEEVEAAASADASEEEAVAAADATANNKKTKSKKKKNEDDADEVANELEKMKLEQSNGKTQNASSKVDKKKIVTKSKSSKISKKCLSSDEDSEEEVMQVRSKFSAFATLGNDMMEMDGDDDKNEEREDDDRGDDSDEVSSPSPPPPVIKQTKKTGKSSKPAVDDWDDLDDLIAPQVNSVVTDKNKTKKDNKKKGKNKKKAADDDDDGDEDFDAILAAARKADGIESPVKIEVKEVFGESKSKKKRKVKGKQPDDEAEANDAVTVVAPVDVAKADTPANDVPADVAKVDSTANDVLPDVTKADSTANDAPADVTKADPTANDAPADVTKADPTANDAPADVTKADSTANDAPADTQEGKEATTPPAGSGLDEAEDTAVQQTKVKKTKKMKQKAVVEEDDAAGAKGAKKTGINKKVLAAMKEIQQKRKEEEEALKKAEEEFRIREEERIRAEEEKERLEVERKERRKQREKERKERLRAEGKLLTAKQKADQRRAMDMLESLKAQGIKVPEVGADKKTPRLGSKAYLKKKLQAKQEVKLATEKVKEEQPAVTPAAPKEASPPLKKEEDDGIKDSWDISSEEEAEDEEEDSSESGKDAASMEKSEKHLLTKTSSEDTSDDEDADDEDDQDDEPLTTREKVIARLKKRRELNEENRDINVLRAPVVCVLGHVDHGKTKILDKLRRTNVQEGEVGGITQQIGATNVPSDAITNMTKMVKSFDIKTLKFPGLLIIDTPGHESFSNLRNRGSSLCDIAILVVDITQGLEPQTIESIDLLKKRKTPFVVALNKVDRIFEWESNQHKDIRDIIKTQKETAQNDFERRYKDIIVKLNEQGLNAALFWENPDTRSYVSLVPTSAITGDGMGNLIALICDMCQTKLATQLRYSLELQCIVLEVKTIQGHGTTIDVILVNGKLREGDHIVLAGTDGAIVTQIRSLLLPKPMKEIRVKGSYDEFKEISAAQGVKLAAKDLDKAIAGLSLRVAQNDDEIEVLKELVEQDFKLAMRAIKVKDKGVYVQASTLGALEALLEFFKTKSIPYSGIRVGPVVKRDVMKAAAMLEHDEKYAVILAFDVKVERDAQELADREGVQIFSEETIYHLGDRYVDYLEERKRKLQEENRSVAVFPCKLKIIPTAIFNKRDPIVLGVTVETGVLRTGTLLCVPGKEFVEIGVVTSMEFDHKVVDVAKKGVDVCIKIDPSQGTTPKLYGRHFEAPDEIVSKISRESINACKEYFRDDLTKADWKLMAELKKLFNIL